MTPTQYATAAARSMERTGCKNLKPLVFYAVKLLSVCERRATPDLTIQIYFFAEHLIGQLTPRELMEIFPVEKRFDGAKWGVKDYFTTMDAVRAHGMDVPLHESANLSKFLHDYQNPDVSDMVVNFMCALSDWHERKKGYGFMEKFSAMTGVPLYHLSPDGSLTRIQCRELDGTDIIYEQEI
jgi:hypothetical protein